MLTSTQTHVLADRLGLEKALRLIFEAGFDCYDFSLFDMLKEDNVFNCPDYLEETKKIRAYADALGLPCNQAHAPFPSSMPFTPENIGYNSAIYDKLTRSMEIAATLGAKAIVIHPQAEVDYMKNREQLAEQNVIFYRSLTPFAQKYGIKIAVENMWQVNPIGGAIVDSVCGRPEEFAAMMDALDPAYFVACLDIGHAALCGHDPADFIRTLGQGRLHALHVHDVDGINDLHTMPFLSKVDFDAVTDALREIGYDGEITLEADKFYHRMPDAILPEAAKLMSAAARAIADRASK